ncbi:MAG TPA: hypothetical protein VFZ65_14435, partial [Planctomycetota bacterium]|nr:hypothetical protein [Planctomycetota bacterium]
AFNPGPGWLYPQNRLSRPLNTFLSSPCHLMLDGAPAGSTSLLIADLMPLAPAGGGVILGEDVLWVNPFAVYYLIAPVAVDAAGHAEVTIPAGLPVGFHMVTQWAVADASAYLGHRFTDALLFRFGLQ